MSRDPGIDNAKGILIFLVVFGHILELPNGWTDPILRAPLTLLYLFHMPAFIFFAGLGTRAGAAWSRVARLVILLVLFQLLYLAHAYARNGVLPDRPWEPYWILWFLMAMIWWIGALPWLLRLRRPLLVSVATALGAGLLPINGIFSVSRSAVFLPFFVAGHLYGPDVLLWTRKLAARHKAVPPLALLALLVLAAATYLANLPNGWLFGNRSYAVLGIPWVAGLGLRAAHTAASALAVLLFLVLLPHRATLFAAIGQTSLGIFLLHGFVVRGFGWLARVEYRHVPELFMPLGLIGAAVLVVLLGRRWIDRLLRDLADGVVEAFGRWRRFRSPASAGDRLD